MGRAEVARMKRAEVARGREKQKTVEQKKKDGRRQSM